MRSAPEGSQRGSGDEQFLLRAGEHAPPVSLALLLAAVVRRLWWSSRGTQTTLTDRPISQLSKQGRGARVLVR